MTVRRALRGLVWFWIDFIVGDDWVVAVVVGVALLATRPVPAPRKRTKCL